MGQYVEWFRRFMDYEFNIEGFEGTCPVPRGAQKTAIARIFMRDMPADILDEPFTTPDPVAEYRLNKSTMQNADRQRF